MSPKQLIQRIKTTSSVAIPGNSRRGLLRSWLAFVVFSLISLLESPTALAADKVNLGTDPAGITLTTIGNNYTASFGTMNALGVGTPATNVNTIQLTTGTIYYTYYDVIMQKVTGGDAAYVTAYVSANFGNTSAMVLESCPYPSSCNASGNYTAMSTNSGAPTNIVPSPGLVQGKTAKIGLAIYLPDNDGASAYTGSLLSNVTITYTAINFNTGTTIGTFTLSLTLNTVQDAVQLTLGQATGGLLPVPGSDYSMNFGNVNGLGISPGAGLTTSTPNGGGGIIYSTPYLIQPAFSDWMNTTATIKICVSKTFTHSTILIPQDSVTGAAGSFSAITTTCNGSTITASAADRSPITRYLGLFVSNINGGSAFTGGDTATITYTMTVP